VAHGMLSPFRRHWYERGRAIRSLPEDDFAVEVHVPARRWLSNFRRGGGRNDGQDELVARSERTVGHCDRNNAAPGLSRALAGWSG
jgi:hypothetical protein